MPKISPWLWFDTEGEEAANFYCSLFDNAKVLDVNHYGEGGPRPGSVMTVTFEIEGQQVTALNAGPEFKFNESFSFFVDCEDQQEVDKLWSALTEGGEESQCGWLKDKFGLSWQIVPKRLMELMQDEDKDKAGRVMQAMMKMQKIDVAKLEEAAAA
jgi:predicted 3-demethylubiquinone-9 3-methyltransferase (glyoxalase superfamily)